MQIIVKSYVKRRKFPILIQAKQTFYSININQRNEKKNNKL
jgi:hypothetical protein